MARLSGSGLFVERLEGLDAIEVVAGGGCLAAAVHGKERIAHIDTLYGKRRGENVAQSATTSHIAMVHETLARYVCLLADTCEDGCRDSIARILLCGIELDDRSASEHGMVRRVVLIAVVRMPGMGIIGRNHKGLLDASMEVLGCVSL